LSDWKEAKETRWSGVAFIIAAGKRKHEKKTAILHEPERPWFVQRSSPFFLPDLLPAECTGRAAIILLQPTGTRY